MRPIPQRVQDACRAILAGDDDIVGRMEDMAAGWRASGMLVTLNWHAKAAKPLPLDDATAGVAEYIGNKCETLPSWLVSVGDLCLQYSSTYPGDRSETCQDSWMQLITTCRDHAPLAAWLEAE